MIPASLYEALSIADVDAIRLSYQKRWKELEEQVGKWNHRNGEMLDPNVVVLEYMNDDRTKHP